MKMWLLRIALMLCSCLLRKRRHPSTRLTSVLAPAQGSGLVKYPCSCRKRPTATAQKTTTSAMVPMTEPPSGQTLHSRSTSSKKYDELHERQSGPRWLAAQLVSPPSAPPRHIACACTPVRLPGLGLLPSSHGRSRKRT